MRRHLAGAVACFVCGAGVAACVAGADADALKSTGLQPLEGGAHSRVAERSFRVVGDARTFRTLYASVHAHRVPPPRPPEVEFDTHVVLAAFLGARSTGGYRTGFGGVSVAGGIARVTVVERSPPAGAVPTQAMTAPYAFAALARRNVSLVEFVDGAGAVVLRQSLP